MRTGATGGCPIPLPEHALGKAGIAHQIQASSLNNALQEQVGRLLDTIPAEALAGGKLGLEKEGMRVSPDGHIAQTPHPAALGSALTHPYITTDYSEALLELITPPLPGAADVLGFLDELQRFCYAHMGDELIWAASMPCVVSGDASIPIARYGTSNVGRMKYLYRVGLGHRYGRVMQAIAGVHFNYSLPESFWRAVSGTTGGAPVTSEQRSAHYMGLVRNVLRHGWLVSYLFGASPALCKSFLPQARGFQEFDYGSYYLPHATSLRMSDIGYKNDVQAGLRIDYNSVDGYAKSLLRATATPAPAYRAIGIEQDGDYRQLNDSLLQIENEYYGIVRPKQIAETGERPALALLRRGVAYVELRALDLGVFDPLGLNLGQMQFLEAFLLLCGLLESPPLDEAEQAEASANLAAVATRGRDPALKLMRRGEPVPLRTWAMALCNAMAPVCERLDNPARDYSHALARQRAAVADPEQTPSARVLAQMRQRGETFFAFARRLSLAHRRYFLDRPLSPETAAWFARLAAESIEQQRQLEQQPQVPFADYLHGYYAQGEGISLAQTG